MSLPFTVSRIVILGLAFLIGTLIPAIGRSATVTDVSIGFSHSPDRQNYRWTGSPVPGDTNCTATVDFNETLLNQTPALLRKVFAKVDVLKSNSEEAAYVDSGLVFRIHISRMHPAGSKWSMAIPITMQIEMELLSGEEKVWNKSLEKTVSHELSGGMYCAQVGEFVGRNANQQLGSLIQDGIGSMNSDSGFLAAIQEANERLSRANSDSFKNLVALDMRYRVTDPEGVIRNKPAAKGSTVRKLGMGSIVQVIGKLPTGWLQVAKEGEAIGWIHEGSVTVMSVQSQPATAVATSAPTKPTKPAPAPVAVPPAPTLAAAPAPATEAFPTKPVAVSFPRGKPAPDDIAVIIGNANYKATAKDIPDVIPAYADAEGMKRYVTQALGIKEENVIFIKDARLTDFVATFGTSDNHKGKLFNWVKPGQTNVFVFYSGHGAPSGDGSSSYLVPVDAQGALIELSAYPIRTLYGNLAKLPAKSVTVVLEACFSGSSQAGTVIKNASPVFQKALQETIPPNLNVITAASGTQIASWEQDKSHGLFTKHYLLGMAGAADKKPYGDGDGRVTTEELAAYLKGTMSYMAQRYYGREQTVQVATGK